MSDQPSRSVPALLGPPSPNKLPHCSETENQTGHPEHILVLRDARDKLFPFPTAVVTRHVRVILDQENGDGNKDKGDPGEKAPDCAGPLSLCQYNHHHHYVAHRLNPPLECNIRII